MGGGTAAGTRGGDAVAGVGAGESAGRLARTHVVWYWGGEGGERERGRERKRERKNRERERSAFTTSHEHPRSFYSTALHKGSLIRNLVCGKSISTVRFFTASGVNIQC